MRKIISILFLLMAFFISKSQSIIQRSTGANTLSDGRVQVRNNLFIPRFSDTIQANMFLGIDSSGAIVFTWLDNKIWKRNNNPRKWEDVSGSGNVGTVTSIGMSVPSAFNVSPSTITSSGTFGITAIGTINQYIRGNGTLASFPTIPAQVNLTDGGLVDITGTYPNLTITGNTPTFQQVLTQGSTLLGNNNINSGTFVLRMNGTAAFGLPSGTTAQRPGSPSRGDTRINPDSSNSIEYYNGTTWKLLANSIGNGRRVDTIYRVNDSTVGYTINGLPYTFEILGSASGGGGGGGGITSLNTLTGATQTFATGTSGTNFTISSVGTVHTFNFPNSSASNRGLLTSADWSTFNSKVSATRTLTAGFAMSGGGDLSADRSFAFDSAAGGTGGGFHTQGSTDTRYALRALTSGNILVGSVGNLATSVTMSGDATIVAGGALTIANNAITTAKIINNAVTFGKMQAITANRLLGSGASGTAVTEITLGTGLSFTGTTLNASATGTDSSIIAQYGLLKSVVGTDRVLRLDSATVYTYVRSLFDANDTINIVNSGASGEQIGRAGHDTLFLNKLVAGTNTTLTRNADSSITIASSGGISTTLTSGNIIVGNGSNVATSVAMSGDATIVAGGALTIGANAITTTKINNNAVTFAKMQAITANKLLGSGASGTAVAEITLGTGLSFSGTTLNATGGGLTDVFKQTDSLMKNTSTFWGRDSVIEGIVKKPVVIATPANIRNDAASLIVLPDRSWMIAYTAYATSSADAGSAIIAVRRSTDYGATWSAVDTAVFNTANGNYIPSLYLRNDGTVLMLYDYQPTPTTSQIRKVTLASPYTVGTWSAPSLVFGSGSDYYSPGGDRILRTHNGALLYPYNINTTPGDLGSQTGNYRGRLLVSYNDGTSWTNVSTFNNGSPDSLCVEAGLYQIDDTGGTIYYYYRTRSGDVYAVKGNASDTTFDQTHQIALGLGAPNSLSTIKYSPQHKMAIAIHNSLDANFDRMQMYMSTSNDNLTWTRVVRLDSLTGYKYFEPFLSFINNELVAGYSRADIATGDTCNLYTNRIPYQYIQAGNPYSNTFNNLVVSAGNLVDNPNLAEFYYRTIPTANAYVKLQNITQGYSFGGAWFRIKNSSQPVLWDNNVPNNTDAYIQNAFWGTSTNVGDAYLISGWKNNGTYKGRIFGNGNASFAGTLTAAGTDSVGTPLNTLWMDALGTIHKGVIPGGGGSGSDTTRSHWFYNGSDTFSIIPTGSGGGGNTTIKTYSGSTIGTLTIDASTIQIVRNNPLFRFQDNVVGAVSTIQNTGYKLAFDGSAGFENFQFNKPIHGLHGGSYDARYDVNAGSFIFNYNGFSSQADPFSFVVTGSTGALGSWYGGTDSRPYSFKIFNNGYAGFGLGSVSAQVHLPGSTTTAGTSALKFTAGSPPTTPETGSMNFNTGLWIIDSSTSVRDTIATRSWARNNISGGSSTNIYNTDGTLTGNRALSGGGNSLDLGTTGSKISTLTANLSADFNVVAAGAISLSPGSSNTVTLGGSSSGVRLQGDVALSSLQTATDANASLTNKTSIILPDITANRTLQFLTVTTGSLIVVFNRNTTGNTWSITGSVTIKDASGSTITNLVNNTVYILLYDGSNLIKIN